jgi:PhnB protein
MKATNFKPKGYTSVTPYLQVSDANRLVSFVTETFGAKEQYIGRGSDGAIQHASFLLGDAVIELAQAAGDWPSTTAALHVYVPDCDATHERAVAAGGVVLHEPKDQFYGERSSAVKDPCGNYWYIATLIEELTEEEIAERAAAAGR